MLTKFNLYQPAAIDNSLNSYQIIHKLIAKMNDVIDEINNIDSKANEYTDEQINILNTQLRAYINELNDITITHFNNVDSMLLSHTYSIETIENDISALQISFNNLAVSVTEQINTSINAIKSYVDLQIEIVKQLIDAQNPEIIDCFGNKNKLQVAYNNMFSAFKYAHGEGTFKKVLDSMKIFSYSTYIDMSNVSYLQFYTNIKNATINTFYAHIFYQGETITSFCVLPKLKTFKDLVTNINVAPILIYKYGYYNNTVPSAELTQFASAIRSIFLSDGNQYTPLTLLNTMRASLR